MSRTDRASLIIDSSMARVFAALVDRDALERWLPPRGMTARFEHFDPSPDGSYRLVLTYSTPPDGGGKSSADTDIVEARFIEIVPGVRVVQEVDFVTDDPMFTGTMTMTWAVHAMNDGTRVDFIAHDVPDGISPEDHLVGMTSSLEQLAQHLDDAPLLRLEPWTGPWPDDDKDANLKADIALYTKVDPLRTVRGLSRATGVPEGAIVRWVLARWASEGSSGLLELGPTLTRRLHDVCIRAETAGTDEARLDAYDQLRQMISWLHHPLEHPDVHDF